MPSNCSAARACKAPGWPSAEINAAGGSARRTPDRAGRRGPTDRHRRSPRQLTEKVITEDRVLAVMGPTSSADRNAMLAICTQHRTPLLYATDYEGGRLFPVPVLLLPDPRPLRQAARYRT
ncbi:MAG: transporter substrate-binding protein [Candidatus Nanopelagicales bacterium]